MPQQSQQDEGFLADTKRGFNLLHRGAEMMAFPVVLTTTKLGTWGSRFLTPSSLLGFFWPLLFGSVYGPDPGLGLLYGYWLASIGLLAIHRAQSAKLQREGYRCHSQYWGTSWFERDDADLKGQERARGKACTLAIVLGFLCFCALSKPLGEMFILGGIAKMFTDAMVFQATRARLRVMEDARIDTEFYARLYRDKHGMN